MKIQLCGVIGQGRSQPIPHKAPGRAGARQEAAAPLRQPALAAVQCERSSEEWLSDCGYEFGPT